MKVLRQACVALSYSEFLALIPQGSRCCGETTPLSLVVMQMNDQAVIRKAWSEIFGTGRAFVKMHGLRNHFVIVDGRGAPYHPAKDDIIRICDPREGVGAEQLVVVEPPSTSGAAAGAYAFMRLFNTDGREVAACGNATRCVAHLLMEECNGAELRLETAAGLLACTREGDFRVSVNMGFISDDWRLFPMSEPVDTMHVPMQSGPLRDGMALHIGNPHIVFFVEDLDAVDMARVAPAIQTDPLFPEGINVGAAQVTGPDRLRLCVWERPGILTEACGSGACVAAFAARARGLMKSSTITVDLPAGPINVQLNRDGTATMTGPVAYCFRGIWEASGQHP
jgi:diaminopimelate epimerase